MEDLQNIPIRALFFAVVFLSAIPIFFIVSQKAVSKIKRWISIFLFLIIIGSEFFIFTQLLGRPRPLGLEQLQSSFFGNREATVLGMLPDSDGGAIYLWLLIDGVEKPTALEIPWSEGTARELERALWLAANGNEEVRVDIDELLRSIEERTTVHPIPQPAPPPKDEE